MKDGTTVLESVKAGLERLQGARRAAGALVICAGLGLAAVFSAAPARAEVAAWIVIDAESGAVLEQKQARRQWYPASITKLMTAYVTFRAIGAGRASMNSAVVVSANAHAEPPSKMGFKPGTQLTLDNALKMLLVKSANDIAVAVAEAIGGSEPAFIAMMNAEARRLGMSATHFVNPHGLPDNRQVSSARDLALLARVIWREYPQYRSYFSHGGIRVGKRTLKSANREFLLRVPGANGMKTGYICNSGLNVAVSATRGNRTVIAVILGAASGVERVAFARELIDKGFDSRRGRSIEQLTGVSGGPPADKYCKRNPRPTAEELLARFGKKSTKRSPLMALFSEDIEGGRIRRGVMPAMAAPAAEGVPLKADGKTDWAKVMDQAIGPRRQALQVIPVGIGTSGGSALPSAPAGAGSTLKVVDVPTPKVKPLGPAAASLVPMGAEKAGKAAAGPAPGAIFNGQPLLLVPVPSPRP
ncbi:D-alanyl-D-alanine carboxypeptidase family protein [Stappia indica]|uniref:D-alanyl-D-alanine carboxypeptidase family protein n=1 Tax=Stappia indica TaxID=538381 RepID=UPI001CD574F7|nr:D-alanyl-D-alanine carboxypeptidase family protein [Stappia indica]MCA1299797.1 D-alanyl-D-alanine carboxypeptidase [Stappia indica]